MNRNRIYFAVATALLAVFASVTGRSDSQPDVLSPQKRAASVDLAAQLIRPPAPESLKVPENIKNPFDPSADAKVVVRLNRPASDKDLLSILADQLHPTGMFILGDTPILMLGQKKVKLKDKLIVSFDGTPYEVEVISIERTTFSLRFNQAEITRAIKPGKNP